MTFYVDLATALEKAARTSQVNVAGRFDLTNPKAVKFARERSASLITGVTETTKDAVRVLAERALEGEFTAEEMAEQLSDFIGVTPGQADSIADYRQELEDAGALSAADIYSEVAGYANDLIDTRSMTIARQEIMTSARAGQNDAWSDAVQAGLLTGDEQRRWIVTDDDRLCPICEELDGATTSLTEPFDGPDGPVDEEGAHVCCRCDIVLQP